MFKINKETLNKHQHTLFFDLLLAEAAVFTTHLTLSPLRLFCICTLRSAIFSSFIFNL